MENTLSIGISTVLKSTLIARISVGEIFQCCNHSAQKSVVNLRAQSRSLTFQFLTYHIPGANSLDEVHGNFNWKSFGALLLIWLLIYACIFKGIGIVSHVVKVTATVPVIIIIILAIMGKYKNWFMVF